MEAGETTIFICEIFNFFMSYTVHNYPMLKLLYKREQKRHNIMFCKEKKIIWRLHRMKSRLDLVCELLLDCNVTTYCYNLKLLLHRFTWIQILSHSIKTNSVSANKNGSVALWNNWVWNLAYKKSKFNKTYFYNYQ